MTDVSKMAGAFFRRTPWMTDVSKMQEHIRRALEGGMPNQQEKFSAPL
jgi:hypothetical protein